jgi:hypothetical protein
MHYILFLISVGIFGKQLIIHTLNIKSSHYYTLYQKFSVFLGNICSMGFWTCFPLLLDIYVLFYYTYWRTMFNFLKWKKISILFPANRVGA